MVKATLFIAIALLSFGLLSPAASFNAFDPQGYDPSGLGGYSESLMLASAELDPDKGAMEDLGETMDEGVENLGEGVERFGEGIEDVGK